jgi:hypothetical protein
MSNRRVLLIFLFTGGLLLGVFAVSIWTARSMDHRAILEISKLGGTFSVRSAVRLRATGVLPSLLEEYLWNPVTEVNLSTESWPRQGTWFPPVTDHDIKRLNLPRNLKTLSLRGMPITDAAIEQLSKHRNLKHFDLRETRITRVGISRLKTALPSCVIISSPGD